MELLISLFVGFVAGSLAGIVVKGEGFGIIGDIVVGLLGGLIGHLIFNQFGLQASGLVGSIVVSFIGALILIGITRMLYRTR